MKDNIELSLKKYTKDVTIHLPVSKSECNRALILSFLSNNEISVADISNSEDSQTLNQLLQQIKTGDRSLLDCGPAGTTFRFLTALLAITEGNSILTGSPRMKERPIGDLVDALNNLGGEISYLEKDGFPPLSIRGKKLAGGSIHLNPGTSSQFVSALMLIGSQLKNGLQIRFTNEPVSFPYIVMTAQLLHQCGIKVDYDKNEIKIDPQNFQKVTLHPEHDWSSASYFYSMVALQKDLKIFLPGLKQESLQGDSITQKIFEQFGVVSVFDDKGLSIYNNQSIFTDFFEYDFTSCPDLAQTLAFTCAGLGISGNFSGLSTLRNKETDRIQALKNELSKCGLKCESTEDTLRFEPKEKIPEEISFRTYDDHRMAMAAAPLIFKTHKITIEDKEVVGKSFPDFWMELNKIISENS